MKIIVTGGAGFIGSHIVDAYIRAGHRVTVIDNLSTGLKKNLNPKAKFYNADIRELKTIEKIFRREKPNIVNHHAAIASVVESLKNPIPTFETNVIGTANLMIAFGNYGIGKNKKFIFASTGGALYGNPKKIPADEEMEVTPLSPYGLSKLLGEEIIKFYSRYFGSNRLIFRYPNVYGPRQNPKGEAGIVAIFSWLMKNKERPTIFGDGSKARDYTYVGDIVRANIIALNRGTDETLNLGWGEPVSDQKIFDTLAAELDFGQKPIYASYRKGEVYKITLNADRAKKSLGWRPKIKLGDGIKKTLPTINPHTFQQDTQTRRKSRGLEGVGIN